MDDPLARCELPSSASAASESGLTPRAAENDGTFGRPVSTGVEATCRDVLVSIGIDFDDFAGAPAATSIAR